MAPSPTINTKVKVLYSIVSFLLMLNIPLVMKDKIALNNDNKYIQGFKNNYDRLYREFKEKLIQEYALMRNAYTAEFE